MTLFLCELRAHGSILCLKQLAKRNGALRIARQACDDRIGEIGEWLAHFRKMWRQMCVCEKLHDVFDHACEAII